MKRYRFCRYEVPSNMWAHWSDEMKQAAAGVVAADDAEAEALHRSITARVRAAKPSHNFYVIPYNQVSKDLPRL